MSPAGAGIRAFRRHTNWQYICTLVAVVGLASCVLLIPGGSRASAHAAPIAALPGWSAFQSACVSGPSPGTGNTPQACVCWEQNLQAVAILPDYALDALNAAQVGGGAAYTVPENIGNVAISQAMQGCGLYPQT